MDHLDGGKCAERNWGRKAVGKELREVSFGGGILFCFEAESCIAQAGLKLIKKHPSASTVQVLGLQECTAISSPGRC